MHRRRGLKSVPQSGEQWQIPPIGRLLLPSVLLLPIRPRAGSHSRRTRCAGAPPPHARAPASRPLQDRCTSLLMPALQRQAAVSPASSSSGSPSMRSLSDTAACSASVPPPSPARRRGRGARAPPHCSCRARAAERASAAFAAAPPRAQRGGAPVPLLAWPARRSTARAARAPLRARPLPSRLRCARAPGWRADAAARGPARRRTARSARGSLHP